MSKTDDYDCGALAPLSRYPYCAYTFCGNEFKTNKGAQKYCGELCRLRNNYYRLTGTKPSEKTGEKAFSRWIVKRCACKAKGIVFSLTDYEVQTLFNMEYCQYCGNEGNCIERMDNDRGYENDNVTWSCRRCNTLKSNRSFEDFANIMKLPLAEQRKHSQIRKYAVAND